MDKMMDHFSDNARGCGTGTVIHTHKECPECGRKLRMAGNLQTLKLYLTCFHCDYRSSDIPLDELNELI
jgi:C4-type Zn-finger protein